MWKFRVRMAIVLLFALVMAGLTCGDEVLRWVFIAAILAPPLIDVVAEIVDGLSRPGKGPDETLS